MVVVFFFKQKTAYEMRISDWSSDVCSSDRAIHQRVGAFAVGEELRVAGVEDVVGFQQALRQHGGIGAGGAEVDALAGEILHGRDAVVGGGGDLQHGRIEVGDGRDRPDRKSTRLNSVN